MPMGADGVYVPLTQFEKDAISRYIGGVLRREPSLTPFQAALRIGTRFDVDQNDALVLYRLINNERSANQAGTVATANPNQAPDYVALPPIPDDPANRGRIITRIVVEITDPATGNVTTSQEEWLSNAPVSDSQILAEIDADRESYFRSLGSGPQSTSPASTLQINVIILSIGRAI